MADMTDLEIEAELTPMAKLAESRFDWLPRVQTNGINGPVVIVEAPTRRGLRQWPGAVPARWLP